MAGLDPKLVADVRTAQDHARNCKKALEDCAVCQHNIIFLQGIPPHTLSRVLAEGRS